jgi:diguanylate cyclase (GGDEF)-like protein
MLDDKTGTISEDFFNFLLDSEGKRAMRYAYFFSILTVEIDQLENGEILTSLADLIRQSTRNTDVIGRIEGRRFAVILHHAEAPNTFSVGERIRDRVASYNFTVKGGQARHTVSVGGACFPTHTPDTRGLVHAADEMLDRAKSTGGNKVYLPEAS